MPDQFLHDVPESAKNLSRDTQAIVNAISSFERRSRAREDSKHAENAAQIQKITVAQKDLQSAVADIISGFPEGDPDAHRRYHESVIVWRELRNRLVRDALTQAAKVGGLAGMGWIAYAVWTAFKLEITR